MRPASSVIVPLTAPMFNVSVAIDLAEYPTFALTACNALASIGAVEQPEDASDPPLDAPEDAAAAPERRSKSPSAIEPLTIGTSPSAIFKSPETVFLPNARRKDDRFAPFAEAVIAVVPCAEAPKFAGGAAISTPNADAKPAVFAMSKV